MEVAHYRSLENTRTFKGSRNPVCQTHRRATWVFVCECIFRAKVDGGQDRALSEEHAKVGDVHRSGCGLVNNEPAGEFADLN